jgi:hypothetical protein
VFKLIRILSWSILEQHWNGAKLVTAETMLEWAKSMTWKGIQRVVNLSKTVLPERDFSVQGGNAGN